MAAKKVFAVVFGGASSEHDVSCVSAAWVVDNINPDIYDVIKIGITKNGVWFLYKGDSEAMRNHSWSGDKENLVPCVISSPNNLHFLSTFYALIVTNSEKAMAPHCSTLPWKIPWAAEPGKLQSMGWRRIGHG